MSKTKTKIAMISDYAPGMGLPGRDGEDGQDAPIILPLVTLDSLQVHGTDIVSASPLNLDTATGDYVDVTGTNPISAITLANGKVRTVRFTGALVLSHNASIILPGTTPTSSSAARAPRRL